MSPKGGIKPHKRFSIQSKRSEVLFVDYIAEHLSSNGRAGVIVPKGIIFQGQNAYIKLRKMLLDKYLVAVVSLPAGVFNPYSNVKTSILIFDKALARSVKTIAFFKIENDGFGLGSKRRVVEQNDLPDVGIELKQYLDDCRRNIQAKAGPSVGKTLKLVVLKSKIEENETHSLSMDSYSAKRELASKWPIVRLGQVAKRISGGTPSKAEPEYWKGDIPWVSPKDMKSPILTDTEDHVTEAAVAASSTKVVPKNTLLCVIRSGILKHTLPLSLTSREMCFNQDVVALVPIDDRLDAEFLYWILKGRSEQILQTGIKPGVTVQSFYKDFFNAMEIPLPPLKAQRKIVDEIDGYNSEITRLRSLISEQDTHVNNKIAGIWGSDATQNKGKG